MDVEPTTTVEPTPGPQAIPEVPEEGPSDCGSLDLANHLQRIDDLRADAYKNPNSSMAVVGLMKSNLAEFEARVSHRALEVLRGGSLAEEDSDITMEVFDQIARVDKQFVQLAHLEVYLSSVESASNSKKPR